MFSERRVAEKKKIFIDNVKAEKITGKVKSGNGVSLAFLPVFDKDVFDDDIVEKLKLYLVNQTDTAYHFHYKLFFGGESSFELKNTIEPLTEFYLHNVNFDDMSDGPRFEVEFSLVNAEKEKRRRISKTALKLKAKQLFKRIEEIQQKNEPMFSYQLFETYPDKVEEEKVDLTKLGNAGFRLYDASRVRENLPAARTVIDLHIEKLTNEWQQLSSFEILTMQLKEFEKFYDLAIAHRQPALTVIHGVGVGKLRDEIHSILKRKKEVASFFNRYSPAYGYGATEIFFSYKP